MAVVLAYRIAIALTPGLYRLVKWEQAASGQPGPTTLARDLLDRLRDPGESDVALSATLSERIGYPANVATYSGSFEVRRCALVWEPDPAVFGSDNVRTVSFDFIKLSGGSPSSEWEAADFEGVEALLGTFWTNLKAFYRPSTVLKRYVWHRRGPGISPPNPSVRTVEVSVAGTEVAQPQLPPAVACSVTERTSSRKHWGRIYLPAPSAVTIDAASGRWTTNWATTLAAHANTLYDGAVTAGKPIVVYSEAKPERSPDASDPRYRTKGTYPPQAALAFSVDQVVVDMTPDTIRSRRHRTSGTRHVNTVG